MKEIGEKQKHAKVKHVLIDYQMKIQIVKF